MALKASNGKVVSVASPESVVLKDLGDAEPGDAETFQWINLMRGDTMLMSLTNHRYLATKPNSPGPVTATATGPNPARKGGACFKWKEAHTRRTQPAERCENRRRNQSTVGRVFPVEDVRLLESPFSRAVEVNRQYLLAHDPGPAARAVSARSRAGAKGTALRQLGEQRARRTYRRTLPFGAFALMIASGADPDGEFRRRLDYMIDELDAKSRRPTATATSGVFQAAETIGSSIAEGQCRTHAEKWAPWYNLHKMFAGLRDAYLLGGNEKARDLLVRFGDWCEQAHVRL